jgi:hypothetical protein
MSITNLIETEAQRSGMRHHGVEAHPNTSAAHLHHHSHSCHSFSARFGKLARRRRAQSLEQISRIEDPRQAGKVEFPDVPNILN